jgi:N-acetylglucosaminyl-diphospho-decaprenol L-rhamnosyltransferase
MKVLVVIVNYRTAGLTIDCLRSLVDEVAAIPGGCRVVVTDNASGDDSIARIESAIRKNGWSRWATLVPLPNNGGFAWGNNQAIAPALGSADPPAFIYLLNPDTLMKPGGIRELLNFLEKNPKVGIAGGATVNRDGIPLSTGFRFHTVLGELEGGLRLGLASKILHNHIVATGAHTKPDQVDWVVGASMMIRREVFDAIGLFDDQYFMYFEEVDFCMRAKRGGWGVSVVPKSEIVHLVGASSGIQMAAQNQKRRPRYWFDSRHRFFIRNYGIFRTILADVAFASGFVVHSVLSMIRRRPRTDPPWLLWDFIRYNMTSWSHR